MLKLITKKRYRAVVFTDEKIFTVERAHTRQILRKGTDICVKFCALPEFAIFLARKVVSRIHFPKSIIVWAAITVDGKTPLVFVEKGVKINAGVYQQRILKDVLNPIECGPCNKIVRQRILQNRRSHFAIRFF